VSGVPQWLDRAVLTLLVFGIFAAGAYGMFRSWRRKAAEQADLLPLPTAPEDAGEPLAPPADGRYIGTTLAGNWQARVVAGGLSDRARATLTVHPGHVRLDRQGTHPVVIPRPAVRAVRADRALAGKVLGPGGMLVITWEHRGALLDTGFAADDRGQQDACHTALRAWVPAPTTQNGGTPE
jgi:cbb3-type cytochrome oxidase subunit 3